ncbi:BLOC-1 related complex subunit 6 isoform X1 [Arctopsyche grandis]|uniref:BLOC-1 related complex subunit 6 isoform X1 n=1 Tax=Arctopsyche grandis TaxID=121162 RepID=UPI00406D8E5C
MSQDDCEETPKCENKELMPALVSPQIPDSSSTKLDLEIEDEIAPQMMASYSEISFNSDQGNECSSTTYQSDLDKTCTPGPSRPLSLSCQSTNSSESKPLDLDGQVMHDGDMTHFVADDLEYKIKLSSPVTKKGDLSSFSSANRSKTGTPLGSSLYRQLLVPQIGQIDITILNDLEHEARRIAQSVDSLIENLSGVLHSISSITADNVEVYKDSVSKTCDAIDSNIKCMYTILAKGEEVFQAMGPVQKHAARISEIRRLLQMFENNL